VLLLAVPLVILSLALKLRRPPQRGVLSQEPLVLLLLQLPQEQEVLQNLPAIGLELVVVVKVDATEKSQEKLVVNISSRA